ncbi:MAG: hypothetical protein VX768_08070 [Planctomycetota bacterium]|nr:hypothetical protein [Planctomycetota bacterium]
MARERAFPHGNPRPLQMGSPAGDKKNLSDEMDSRLDVLVSKQYENK